ncbi:MAG: hypothetical protein HETSPECPRED_002730 [Heterodermia speciosa]|uniref:Uncharacterized protein n=1 Tax=Heterodermia speciosa TaxID=116794 RepID=A0A8H3F870_9LECA|nr:MAG: hypothetical protein HETSPECPRED_002730 [Heterodermia speciosa]
MAFKARRIHYVDKVRGNSKTALLAAMIDEPKATRGGRHYIQPPEPPSLQLNIVPGYLTNSLHPSLKQPSAVTFAVAVLIFSFASTTIHHLHDRDPFQNRILSLCVLLAVASVQLSSRALADTFEKLRTILPVSIMAGLWLSATLHWVIKRFDVGSPIDDALDEQQIAIHLLDEKDGSNIIE